jgi:hypothetical protein
MAPVLGTLASFAPMFIANKPFFALASYTDAIQGIHFVALTTSAVACAEALELALMIDRNDADGYEARSVVASVIVNIMLLLIVTAMLSRYIVVSQPREFVPTIWQFLVAIALLAISVWVGVSLKWSLAEKKK